MNVGGECGANCWVQEAPQGAGTCGEIAYCLRTGARFRTTMSRAQAGHPPGLSGSQRGSLLLATSSVLSWGTWLLGVPRPPLRTQPCTPNGLLQTKEYMPGEEAGCS